MKKPIYKRWWFWVVIVVVVAAIASGSGGNKEKKEENNIAQNEEKQQDSTITVQQQESDEVTIKEQVLLEQNGVKITAKELTQDSIWGPAVKVLIENNSEENVTVQVRHMSVNGIMADPLFSCQVAAGKSANDTITLLDTSLKAAGINVIQNMEFSFHIFNSESWDTIFDSDTITLSTSADGTEVQEIDAGGTLVLEQNGLSVTIMEVDSQDSFWGADIYVYIENNSDQNLTVQARSVSINGFMVEPIFSSEVTAGKKAFDSITFLETNLTDNGIESIDTLDITFHVFDTDNWNTIFDSENITVTFQ